jgi:hypothetical protein
MNHTIGELLGWVWVGAKVAGVLLGVPLAAFGAFCVWSWRGGYRW